QNNAKNTILNLYKTGKPKAALLHGVTGSGKTNVIKAVTDEVLKSGRQVITLVPEIALTPQTVALFKSYYGKRVTVVHSGLSAGERYDSWRKMKNGDVSICVGTRSAIFAPFENIGLIVMDEEQEHTYKSDMTPKYHARDIARFRCAEHKALMLLSSATPSVESYNKALNGTYTLVELKHRYGNAVIPDAMKADMREDAQQGIMSPVGTFLREEIQKNLDSGEQTILFINRRGYNNFVSCPMCGKVIMCPRCSVSLTFHNSGHLRCHYCGHTEDKPDICPACESKHIAFLGYGTQKVEEELKELFPDGRILRMDADTTSGKFAFDGILESFRNQDADILLGTQMVAKGHDFPNVSLVGVISADMSLYVSDYRANEHTFALITQVIGRAGRSDIKGRAVIQSFNPTHPILDMAAEQNYKEFYENEIAFRKALLFPPFCDLISVMFTSESENEALNVSIAFAKRLHELKKTIFSDISLIIFGPFEAPIYKLNDKFRMRLVIKCRINNKTRNLFDNLLKEFSESLYKKILIGIDVNPTQI
ncbi:MAG: primosomal protein N', partial [Oscillospiraceae bacterium]|nr:primosomal protein N' [Oscillospiraceae bacterium]